MGLDMYLSKKTYVKQWDHTAPEDKYEVEVTKGGVLFNGIKPDRVKYIEEEVGYWRKANQIHNWFVNNVQNGNDNCGEYYVSDSSLKELLNVCKKVDADNSLASKLLPTADGFFFGSTIYDEWYFEDIKNTIQILESVLNEESTADVHFSYSSSW